jgi:hypothetical protein
MDDPALVAPPAGPAAATPAAPRLEAPVEAARGATPGPSPGTGWTVLRDCALGGDGPPVALVLLHPGTGVALVDFAPNDTDAAGRFRAALDARRFPAIFGGYPPVVRAVLPADRLPDLGRIISEGFKAQKPLSLAGGDAWVRSARAAVEAEAPVEAPEPLRPRRNDGFPWTAAAFAAAAGGLVGLLVAVLVLPAGRAPVDPAAPAAAQDGTGAPAAPRAAGPAPAGPAAVPGADAVTQPRHSATAPPPEAAPAAGEEPPPEPAHADAGTFRDGPPAAEAPAAAAGPQQPTADTEASRVAPPVPERAPDAIGAAAASAAAEPPSGPVGTAGVDTPRPEQPTQDDKTAASPDPAPKRPTAPPAEAPPRPAAQAPAAAGGARRATTPATPAEAAGKDRCGAILKRVMLGEALSDADRDYLRRGCDRRG